MTIVADSQARQLTAIPTGTWSIDPAHSTVEFLVKYLGLATIRGRVPGVSGTIRAGDEPSIEGTAAVSSITTFDETRDVHLQSPDFFDAARHPELRFRSTRVETRGDAVVVDGELTVKGVTKPVTLEGRFLGTGVDPWGNERIGLELAATVDRTDFGLTWNAPLPEGGLLLPDEVEITGNLSAVKAG